MSKRETFMTSLALLGAAFDRKISEPLIEGYWIALQALGDDEMATAVKRALAECRFMPAPSELLVLAGRGRNLTAKIAQAWDAVRKAIDQHDYTTSVDFGPLVNAVVRNLGGWDALCRAKRDDLDVWRRKEFERVYEAFEAVAPGSLNGEPHRGAFGGAPVPIAIGGVTPPKQLAGAVSGSSGVARALADQKGA